MKEELVTFFTAKLAKEKGFNLPMCIVYHVESKTIEIAFTSKSNKDFKDIHITAPTQCLLQRWLREIHNIHVFVIISKLKGKNKKIAYSYVYGKDDRIHEFDGLVFTTSKKTYYEYEQTLEIGLQEALKLIK